MLVVAPLSGHFATLLRSTVRTMLADHDEIFVLSNKMEFDTETVVWTAGVKANPVLKNSDLPLDKMGRVIALPTLQGDLDFVDVLESGLERFDLAKSRTDVLVDGVDAFAVTGDGQRMAVQDGGDLRVVPTDRKADSDDHDSVDVDLSRVRVVVLVRYERATVIVACQRQPLVML